MTHVALGLDPHCLGLVVRVGERASRRTSSGATLRCKRCGLTGSEAWWWNVFFEHGTFASDLVPDYRPKTDATASAMRAARARALVYVHVLAYPGLSARALAEKCRLTQTNARDRLLELNQDDLIIMDTRGRAYGIPQPDPQARAKIAQLTSIAPAGMIREAARS